jgi:hypothetical protein
MAVTVAHVLPSRSRRASQVSRVHSPCTRGTRGHALCGTGNRGPIIRTTVREHADLSRKRYAPLLCGEYWQNASEARRHGEFFAQLENSSAVVSWSLLVSRDQEFPSRRARHSRCPAPPPSSNRRSMNGSSARTTRVSVAPPAATA